MRILIVEDDPATLELLRFWADQWNFEAVAVGRGDDAWVILQHEDAPNLVLLDWNMPGLNGPDVCRLVRERNHSHYTYLLMLTNRQSKEDMVAGLEAGADDYLMKPFHPDELHARLRAGRRIVELNRRLVSTQEALRYEAGHDGLTGLFNRTQVMEILGTEIDRSQRNDSNLAVIMVDLDHFKNVNDTYGHISGDIVLREAAHVIRQAVRIYDSAGRFGGEEFLVVAPGCDTAACMRLADRICDTIRAHEITLPQGKLSITVSVGVASTDTHTSNDLLHAADEALYQAKQHGRNRVEIAAGISLPFVMEAVPRRLSTQ